MEQIYTYHSNTKQLPENTNHFGIYLYPRDILICHYHHEHYINENLNKFYKAINDNLESVNHLSNSFLPKRKYV